MLTRGRKCCKLFPPSVSLLTRLFNSSGAVQSRGLAAVTVLPERAEGRVGGRFFGHGLRTGAVMAWFVFMDILDFRQ